MRSDVRRHLILLAAVALHAAPSLARAQGALPADSLERGRTWNRLFVAGRADSLLAALGPVPRGPFASRASLDQLMADLDPVFTPGWRVTEERFVWRGGLRQYWATMGPEATSPQVVLRWVMLPDGRFGGFGANPPSEVPPIDSGGPPIRRP